MLWAVARANFWYQNISTVNMNFREFPSWFNERDVPYIINIFIFREKITIVSTRGKALGGIRDSVCLRIIFCVLNTRNIKNNPSKICRTKVIRKWIWEIWDFDIKQFPITENKNSDKFDQHFIFYFLFLETSYKLQGAQLDNSLM